MGAAKRQLELAAVLSYVSRSEEKRRHLVWLTHASLWRMRFRALVPIEAEPGQRGTVYLEDAEGMFPVPVELTQPGSTCAAGVIVERVDTRLRLRRLLRDRFDASGIVRTVRALEWTDTPL